MPGSVQEVEGPFFIVIEGIDGSGKGTQAQYLYDFVKRTYPHLNPVLTSEPTRTGSGKLLRQFLKEDVLEPQALALLFAMDRLQHVCETILPNLKLGRCVISERYVYSSLVYQSVSGADLAWVTEINKFAVIPDLMIYLDVPPEESRKRVISRLEKDRRYRKDGQKRELEFFEKHESFLSFHEETAAMFRDLVDKKLDITLKSGGTKFPNFADTNLASVDGLPLAKLVHPHIASLAEKLLLGELPRITNKYDYSLVPTSSLDVFRKSAPWLQEFVNTRKKDKVEAGVQTTLG